MEACLALLVHHRAPPGWFPSRAKHPRDPAARERLVDVCLEPQLEGQG